MKLDIPFAKEENLPTLKNIIDGLNAIDALSLEGLSYLEIKKIFVDNLGIHPPQLIRPLAEPFSNVYRASLIEEGELDISDIKSFSHPPVEFAEKGRANLKGFPVFYGAIDINTALRERKKKNDVPLAKGDIVYVSKWTTKKNTQINYSQFVFGDTVEIGDFIKGINNKTYDAVKKMSIGYSIDRQDAFMTLSQKIGEYFLLNDYTKSSFLGHYLLYDNSIDTPIRINAILYPSVQVGLNSINLAIHPDYVKENMELVNVQKFEFECFENNGCRTGLKQIGYPNENKIIEWYKITYRYLSLEFIDTNDEIIIKSNTYEIRALYISDNLAFRLNAEEWLEKNLAKDLMETTKLFIENDEKEIIKRYEKVFADNVILNEKVCKKIIIEVKFNLEKSDN